MDLKSKNIAMAVGLLCAIAGTQANATITLQEETGLKVSPKIFTGTWEGWADALDKLKSHERDRLDKEIIKDNGLDKASIDGKVYDLFEGIGMIAKQTTREEWEKWGEDLNKAYQDGDVEKILQLRKESIEKNINWISNLNDFHNLKIHKYFSFREFPRLVADAIKNQKKNKFQEKAEPSSSEES